MTDCSGGGGRRSLWLPFWTTKRKFIKWFTSIQILDNMTLVKK
jgi:hypothetical protein